MDLPIEILDREIARAHAASVANAGPDADDESPLDAFRHATRKATFQDLEGTKEPLGIAARRWVHALTLERVVWSDARRVQGARRAPRITLVEAAKLPLTTSAHDLVVAILREPSPVRRRTLADALANGASHVRDAAIIHAERRAEASRLLGAPLDAIEDPTEKPGVLASIATRLLADTSALVARSARAKGWTDVFVAALGVDAAEGWPARLRTRWLVDLFRGPLTDGLELDVGPLPSALGASSFARTLGRFGRALADKDGPSGFFSLARSPFDVRRERRAALFASLASDPTFAAHALGLGRDRAREQARRVGQAMLTTARIDAARVLCRGALRLSSSARDACFEEAMAAAVGTPPPPSLVGVLPRLEPRDASRFVGLVLAASDRRRLIDRFDEDWFRNPHAARAIREEDATPMALPRVEEDALARGTEEIVRAIQSLG